MHTEHRELYVGLFWHDGGGSGGCAAPVGARVAAGCDRPPAAAAEAAGLPAAAAEGPVQGGAMVAAPGRIPLAAGLGAQ